MISTFKTIPTFTILLWVACNILFEGTASAQDSIIKKNTSVYSIKDTQTLKLDVYHTGKLTDKQPTIIFVFAGGFTSGTRDNAYYTDYFNFMAKKGYKVVPIDYRLGLKNAKQPTLFNTSNLEHAVDLALEDLFDATNYLYKNADSLGVDTNMIVLSGSSAGAVTVLQADFEKRNNSKISQKLPSTFQYKGVIAFSGGILSYNGDPRYAKAPAPTMFFHGELDKTVPFNKVKLLNRGMFGSRYLASVFKKNRYPYYFQFVENMGHEIAIIPMIVNLNDILWFVQNYIEKDKKYLMEVDFEDMEQKRINANPAPSQK